MKRQDIDPSKIRSILVLVPVSGAAGTGSFKLGDVEQLRDSQGIISVEAFNTTLMTKGPNGEVNAPDAFYKNAFLSLMDSTNTEIRSRIPLASLIRSNGNTAIEKLNMFPKDGQKVVDPQRSNVTCGDLSTLGAGTVVMLNFTYINK